MVAMSDPCSRPKSFCRESSRGRPSSRHAPRKLPRSGALIARGMGEFKECSTVGLNGGTENSFDPRCLFDAAGPDLGFQCGDPRLQGLVLLARTPRHVLYPL